jgi:hypothetical protein
MEYAVDLNFRDRTARHRGQKHAPQRVAQGVAKATFERLNDYTCLTRRNGLHLDDTGLQELGD